MLCFSPLKDLCCTMQLHLTLQLVTHILLLCCMIMCGLSSIQQVKPVAKWCHHLPSDNVTPHHCHDIQALQQDWDWEIPAHPAYSPTFASYDFLLFPHIKKPLRECRFNLPTPSSLLSRNLCVNRALISTGLQLTSCHIGGRSAKFLERIMLSREHVEFLPGG